MFDYRRPVPVHVRTNIQTCRETYRESHAGCLTGKERGGIVPVGRVRVPVALFGRACNAEASYLGFGTCCGSCGVNV